MKLAKAGAKAWHEQGPEDAHKRRRENKIKMLKNTARDGIKKSQ